MAKKGPMLHRFLKHELKLRTLPFAVKSFPRLKNLSTKQTHYHRFTNAVEATLLKRRLPEIQFESCQKES